MTVVVGEGVAVEGGDGTWSKRASCTKGCSGVGKGNACGSRRWYWSVCSGLGGEYEHGSGARRWAGMAAKVKAEGAASWGERPWAWLWSGALAAAMASGYGA